MVQQGNSLQGDSDSILDSSLQDLNDFINPLSTYLTLFIKDHIAEVFEKWSNIEDEIWAKVGLKLP